MKKSEGLVKLEEMAMQRKRERYPNVKPECLPRQTYSDKDTKSLTKAVIDTFILNGYFATRIDSKGTYNQALQRFIPSNQKKGLPDTYAQVSGKPPIWIEIKCEATKDRLKPHQVEVIEQLKQSGALVYIAKNYQGFYEWFKSEIANNE